MFGFPLKNLSVHVVCSCQELRSWSTTIFRFSDGWIPYAAYGTGENWGRDIKWRKLRQRWLRSCVSAVISRKMGRTAFTATPTRWGDVLSKVDAALGEQGLASLVVPELISLEEVKTAKGNIEHLATVKVNITLIDRDSDERVLITGSGSGQNSGDEGADDSHQVRLYAQPFHQYGRWSIGRCADRWKYVRWTCKESCSD